MTLNEQRIGRLQLLKDTLKGIQRVPTLPLNNPTEALSQIHLEGYTQS